MVSLFHVPSPLTRRKSRAASSVTEISGRLISIPGAAASAPARRRPFGAQSGAQGEARQREDRKVIP